MQKNNRICAGVITYNPDIEKLQQNLNSLIPQVEIVIIVDNGSDNVADIKEIIRNRSSLKILYNRINLGIAKALNQVCKLAKENNYDWVLTMDQDSVCETNMVKNLAAHISYPQLGIIAPRVEFKDGDDLILSTKDKDLQVVKISACITSGSLTSIIAWDKIGGFDEWLFIDRVDNEFCTHLRKEGYSIIRVNEAVLYQRAGEMKYISFPLIGKILLPYYSENRNYYICRNEIYLFRKYHRDLNLIHNILTFIYSQTIKIVFEKNRKATLRSTFKGIFDGIRKKIEYVNYVDR